LAATAENDRDARHLRRVLGRGVASPTSAIVREVGAELLDRLAPVRIRPRRVLDLGCGSGALAQELARRYRDADVMAVDFVPRLLAPMARRRLFGRRPHPVAADVRRLPVADASVDLMVSNLVLPWIDDLPALFREWRRVLRPDGVLMFSSLGPDTLAELRTAWAEVDAYPHVREFADMHDVGDAMLGAGLRDPVMDVDRMHRDYRDLRELLTALRAAGSANTHPQRARGLMGRGAWQRLQAVCAPTGSVRVSWEIVYGHAWGAEIARAGHGDAREFHVPIDSIGHRRAKR
jgi:malonyl-CoA O-methyltransferase